MPPEVTVLRPSRANAAAVHHSDSANEASAPVLGADDSDDNLPSTAVDRTGQSQGVAASVVTSVDETLPPAPLRKTRKPRPARRRVSAGTLVSAPKSRKAPKPRVEQSLQESDDPAAPVKVAEVVSSQASPQSDAMQTPPAVISITERGAGVAPMRAPASSDLRRGVVAGLIVAVALVVLALAMRPGVGDSASAPAAAAVPTALGSAPVLAPATTTGLVATPARDITVRLRLGPGFSDAYGASLRSAVDAGGYASVELRSMPYPVDRPRIQFYDPADRPAAEALARALAPLTGELVETRDLAPIARPDEAGSVDVWLAAQPATP